MGWLHLNKEQSADMRQAIEEIDDHSSDRASAIVAAAFVEDQLTSFIQKHLIHDEKISPLMFKPDAPLGQFGSKINLGFLMGLYTKQACDELLTIKKIRNDFSHKMGINDFYEDRIKALCSRLSLWEKIKIKISNEHGRQKNSNAKLTLTMGEDLLEGEQELFLIDPLLVGADGYTPRQRYINACKFFIAGFSVLVDFPHKIPDAAFQVREGSSS